MAKTQFWQVQTVPVKIDNTLFTNSQKLIVHNCSTELYNDKDFPIYGDKELDTDIRMRIQAVDKIKGPLINTNNKTVKGGFTVSYFLEISSILGSLHDTKSQLIILSLIWFQLKG